MKKFIINKRKFIIPIVFLIIIVGIIFLVFFTNKKTKYSYKEIFKIVKKESINYNFKLGRKYLTNHIYNFDIIDDYKLDYLTDPANSNKKCKGVVHTSIKEPAKDYKDVVVVYYTEIICSKKTINKKYEYKLGDSYSK